MDGMQHVRFMRYAFCVWVGLAAPATAMADSPSVEFEQTVVSHAGHLQTPFDKIPDFAGTPTIFSVKNGVWTDPGVWSQGRLPGPSDVVLIRHRVVYNSVSSVVHTLAIDAGGAWVCALTQSTKLSVGTLLNKPGGNLECGTAAAPLPAAYKAEIVIRDLPLQTSPNTTGVYDPGQYGTGILAVDAAVHMHGSPVTTFLRLAAEPLAGSRTLTLTQAPSGWRAGDQLVLPDTRQLVGADYAPRPNGNTDNIRRRISQSESATIQSIAGATITLVAPLGFDHKGARDPDGQLQFLPHVGHLSRNITIRSENPTGTRGHVLLTRISDLDIRFVGFEDLGRTTEAMIDSTTYDVNGVVTHLGTNQIGRYPFHIHHVPGLCPAQTYQFMVLGNVVRRARKWSMTVHGSHYGLVQDNVVFDATGAGIVTEDGSETGNVFDHNFIVKVENGTRLVDPIEITGGSDPFGRKGNGFWFRGIANIVRNNVVADTREGINYSPGSAESGPTSTLNDIKVPLYPCADTSVAGQFTTQQLLRTYNKEVSNNEIYSTSQFGFGTWFTEMPTTGRVPFKKTTIWHFAGTAGLYHRYWNGSEDGLTILNEGGAGLAVAQDNYHRTGMAMYSEIRNLNIQGVNTIFNKLGQLALGPVWLFQDGLFRSVNGFALNSAGQANMSSAFTFRNLRFQPLPGQPLKAFTLTTNGNDINNHAKTFLVYGYQGNANDNLRVYYTNQAPSAPAPPPNISAYLGGGCPTGLTNQQCWNVYQNAMYQALAACSATRPEMTGAFVCPVSATPPPPTPTPTPTPIPPTPPSTPKPTPPPTPKPTPPPTPTPSPVPVPDKPKSTPTGPTAGSSTAPVTITPPPAPAPTTSATPVTLEVECTASVFEITSSATLVFARAPTDPTQRLFVCSGLFTPEAEGVMTMSWLGWTSNVAAHREVQIPTGLVPVGQGLTLKWTSTGRVRGWISVRVTTTQ